MMSPGEAWENVPEPFITNGDGLRLHCHYWEPDLGQGGELRGLVCVMHGAGEHCGRYDELAKTLTRHSLLVFGHDHVGHGRSTRVRLADIHVDMHVRDCLQHVRRVRGTHPRLPCFLLGHSLGGAVSVLAACERTNEFAGVVLIAPLLKMSEEFATPCKVLMAKFFSCICPNFPLGSLDPSLLSRDAREVEDYASDPLVYHGRVRVAFAVRLLHTVSLLARLMPSVSWPFLLLHGSRDQLCDPAGSQMLYDKAASTDKTIRMYEGAYHVLHRELPDVKEAVLREIQQWIVARLPD
ncbi:monoglyceride lipase [Lethenteron reissneri]|uniref:monoglyceride lipase n=1 Tax=Lethenteron reissneri TaxID=7753 RepID=UPI002AB6581F|nr:monoglyceride lipase [Lethenteron reissneri]